MSNCTSQVIGIKQMLKELGFVLSPVLLCRDNQGAILPVQNLINWKNNRHIYIKYHFIRDPIQVSQDIELFYIPGKDNPADIFTKNLGYVCQVWEILISSWTCHLSWLTHMKCSLVYIYVWTYYGTYIRYGGCWSMYFLYFLLVHMRLHKRYLHRTIVTSDPLSDLLSTSTGYEPCSSSVTP